MAAPAQHPTWSTDTNFSTGPDVGTPTKVEPSAGVKAEGNVPGTPLPAQRLNWWKNLVGLWTTWLGAERDRMAAYIGGETGADEWAYDAPRTRTHIFAYSDTLLGTTAAGAPEWAVEDGGGAGPRLRPIVGGGGGSGVRSHAWVSLNLPEGAVISAVRVLVSQVGGLASGDQWAASLERQVNWDFSPAFAPGRQTVGALVESGGVGPAPVVMAWTGLSETVTNVARTYHVHVEGPTSVGLEYLYGVEVTYADPGPRNH